MASNREGFTARPELTGRLYCMTPCLKHHYTETSLILYCITPPVTPGDGLKPRGLHCVAPCKKRPKNKKPGCPFRSIRAFGLDLSVCRQVLSICDKRFVQPPDAVLLIGSTNIGYETCFIDRAAKLRAMHCIICCAHGPATVCQRYCPRG